MLPIRKTILRAVLPIFLANCINFEQWPLLSLPETKVKVMIGFEETMGIVYWSGNAKDKKLDACTTMQSSYATFSFC